MLKDPFPYDGPIERLDGQRPFNHYLWPTECWPAYSEQRFQRPHVPYAFRIQIIALADGRFSTDGSVWSIESGENYGRPCVFATRDAAIRSSAAEMIRMARRCIHDEKSILARDCRRVLPDVINWARDLVARETGKPAPTRVSIRVPALKRQLIGLPLFDFGLEGAV